MRALVVEDEAALRDGLRAQLVEQGFTVDVAADGNEGLFAGSEYPLDIAVIDLARLVCDAVGFKGEIRTDTSKPDGTPRKLMSGGSNGFDTWVGQARDVAGVKVLGLKSEVTDRAALRELAEKLRDTLGESVVLVGSVHDGKAQLVLTVSKALTARFKAGELIRPIAEIVGGSGGGRPDMAQAGGTEIGKLDDAIEALYSGVGASN